MERELEQKEEEQKKKSLNRLNSHYRNKINFVFLTHAKKTRKCALLYSSSKCRVDLK